MKYSLFLSALPLVLMALPLAAQDFVLFDYSAGVPQQTGWEWQSFADRVMGGKSDLITPSVVNTPDGPAWRLAGKVVTKGGGFIQVRLEKQKGNFDASAFSGIEVSVSAEAGGSYFVFLRTKDNFFPWSYYSAPLALTGGKQTVRLPWSAFSAESTGRKTVRAESLSSVALVAAFKDFDADLKIYRVALYK